MTLPILFCLAALCAFPAHAENLGYRGTEKNSLGYESYEAALAAKRRDPSMTIRNENGWILATSKDGLEIWSFTLIGHYAHPSFARRKAAQKGDEWLMQTEMQCGATKPLCDRLIGEYRDLDRRMKEDTDARQRK